MPGCFRGGLLIRIRSVSALANQISVASELCRCSAAHTIVPRSPRARGLALGLARAAAPQLGTLFTSGSRVRTVINEKFVSLERFSFGSLSHAGCTVSTTGSEGHP